MTFPHIKPRRVVDRRPWGPDVLGLGLVLMVMVAPWPIYSLVTMTGLVGGPNVVLSAAAFVAFTAATTYLLARYSWVDWEWIAAGAGLWSVITGLWALEEESLALVSIAAICFAAPFLTGCLGRSQRRRLIDWGLCAGCSYSLRGLTASQCPECGREVDWSKIACPRCGVAIGSGTPRKCASCGLRFGAKRRRRIADSSVQLPANESARRG